MDDDKYNNNNNNSSPSFVTLGNLLDAFRFHESNFKF